MGKTTLALAVLHHPSVVDRYRSRRFFVACDPAEGRSNFLSTLAAAFGIPASDRKTVQLQLVETLGSDPTLLVLDNFESAWEADYQRAEAEEVLLLLGSIVNLSLLVSLRGAEKPRGIQWNRNALPPLEPLDNVAALHMFFSIVDAENSDPKVASDLIHRIDNIPLAIVLMANLAQVEPLDFLLRRWDEVKTAMLVRGDAQHRLTSLEISIRLSLHSPRMQSARAAVRMLALLSLLPQGAKYDDACSWSIEYAPQTISALLANSLAVRRAEGRIYVLSPIRSYMMEYHPPPDDDLAPLFQHYFGLAELAHGAAESVDSELFATTVVPEITNVEAAIRYALHHSSGAFCRAALQAVNCLALQYRYTTDGSIPELLPLALPFAQRLGTDVVHADFLYLWGSMAESMALPGDDAALIRKALDLYELVGSAKGAMDCRIVLSRWLPVVDAIDEGQRLFSQADAAKDHRRMARSARVLAHALQRDGRPAEAIAQYERALSIVQQDVGYAIHDPEISSWLLRLAQMHLSVGAVGRALTIGHEALRMFETTQSPRGMIDMRLHLALAYSCKGDIRAAVEHATAALDVRLAPSHFHTTQCLSMLAVFHSMLGDEHGASEALTRCAGFTRARALSPAEQCDFQVCSASVAMWRGDLPEARALLHATRVLCCSGVFPGETAEDMLYLDWRAVLTLASVEAQEGNAGAAARLATTAAVQMRHLNRPMDVLPSLVLLAEAADDELAALLLDAVFPALYRMETSHEIALALLRSARLASARGEHRLAKHRAMSSVGRFGDIKDVQRLNIARAIIDAADDVGNAE